MFLGSIIGLKAWPLKRKLAKAIKSQGPFIRQYVLSVLPR